MKASGAEDKADLARRALATRLMNEVLDCDPAILGLLVLGNVGRLISVGRSSQLKESEYVSQMMVKNFGSIAALILSAARNATEFMGGLELVIGVFKNQKVLLMNLQEYNLALALRLSRSANANYVYRKIVNTFGTS